VDWAYFLSEFTSWLPGRPRALRDMPTCNAAYRVEVLRRAGGFSEAPVLSADSLLHWTLRERLGMTLRFVPQMTVRHCYDGSGRQLLTRRFEHGRSLAHARRVFGRLGVWRRTAWVALGIGPLPLFYALRLLRHCLGHADVPLSAFLRALPLTLAGLACWALGQAMGMLGALPEGAVAGHQGP
jgi:hypothetical protein